MNNKDLILQYVDTGLRLPENQVVQLPNWAKKTYIRKRVIGINNRHQLKFYEIKLLGDSAKKKYFETIGSDDLKQLFRSEDIKEGIIQADTVINTYINIVDMKGVFHFNSVLEYISDENKDNFINSYLDNNISNMAGHEVSNIIMNSNNPMPFIIRMFTNEHVLSIMKKKTIDYIHDRVGLDNFLNKLNYKAALRLSNLFIAMVNHNDRDIIFSICNYLINAKFDDSIHDELISFLFWFKEVYKRDVVNALLKNLSPEKIKSIFSNIDYYVDVEKLGPIGKQLAIKYGGMEDSRPTFEEVYNEIIDANDYYGDDNNKGKFIATDLLEEPVPEWAIDMGMGRGWFYNDSSMKEDTYIHTLTREQLSAIVKNKIPKIFDLKK